MIVTRQPSFYGGSNEELKTITFKRWQFLDFLVMQAGIVRDIAVNQNTEVKLQFVVSRRHLVDLYTIDSSDEDREVMWLLVLYVINWRQLRFELLSDNELFLARHAAEQTGTEDWKPIAKAATSLSLKMFERYALWALCITMGFKMNALDRRGSNRSITSALAQLNVAQPKLEDLLELLLDE